MTCLGVSSSLAAKQLSSQYIAGLYVVGSPAAQLSTRTEARALAANRAATLPGAFVLRGQGRSMQPLYPSNTLLVVQPQPFTQLSRGMTVVFRNAENRSITHVLVAKTANGWRTAGLHNRRPDALPVTAANFQGVVVAAYAMIDGATVASR